MSCCTDTYCQNLICELQNDFNQSVLLFTADGFAYFGRVKKIFDHKIALLAPGVGQQQLLIRHPDQTFCPQGCSVIQEDFTFLDLRKVVAFTAPLFSVPCDFVFTAPQ